MQKCDHVELVEEKDKGAWRCGVCERLVCGRSKKGGGLCGNAAGHKTAHPGKGACKFHGGNNPVGLSHKSTTHGLDHRGKYTKILRGVLKETYDAMEADEELRGHEEHLKLLESRLYEIVSTINNGSANGNAKELWHEAMKVMDLMRQIKIADHKKRRDEHRTLTADQAVHLATVLINLALDCISETDQRVKFAKGLKRLRLEVPMEVNG